MFLDWEVLLFPVVLPCLALWIHHTVAGKVAAESDAPCVRKPAFVIFRSLAYAFDDLLVHNMSEDRLVCIQPGCQFSFSVLGILSHFSLTMFSSPPYCSQVPIVHMVAFLKVTRTTFESSSLLHSLQLFSLGLDGL